MILTNRGIGDLSISSVTPAGADAPSFSTANNTCSGTTLVPGGTCTVGATFHPLRLGLHTATLEFADDTLDSPQSLDLEGHGFSQATVTPSFHRFSSRPDSTWSEWIAVTYLNRGVVDLHVSGVAMGGASPTSFPTSRDRCSGQTIAPGGTCKVRVRFQPDGKGFKAATLEIADDAPGSPRTVALSGTGTPGPWLTASAPQLKFGHVPIGGTSTAKSVTLENTGSAPMDVSSVAIDGANPANFGDLSTTCGGSLAPNQSCTAQLAFKPQATGEKRATLTIRTPRRRACFTSTCAAPAPERRWVIPVRM